MYGLCFRYSAVNTAVSNSIIDFPKFVLYVNGNKSYCLIVLNFNYITITDTISINRTTLRIVFQING